MSKEQVKKDYFPLKKPCGNCPFRKSQGRFFQLGENRIQEIFSAPSFRCHKHPDTPEGPSKVQCHGALAVLAKSGKTNQMLHMATSLGVISTDDLDPENACYSSVDEVIKGHSDSTPDSD